MIAEICQNNPYCQDHFVKDNFLALLCRQLDTDEDPSCRVKAIYAISCLCRDYQPGLDAFAALDGWSIVVRAIQSNVAKLRTKACFFLAAVAALDARLVEELVRMGLMLQLGSILQESDADATHEHVLNALLALVNRSEKARADACTPGLELGPLLRGRVKEWSGREEYEESVEHCQRLISLCFKDDEETAADR